MPEQQFHIEATNQSVYVRMDAGRTRFFALASFVCLAVLGICALLFLPGKHGDPSMWHDLSAGPAGSAGFLTRLALLLCSPLFMVVTTKRYVMLAYPSDETFRCDRSTLSISRVRWFDVDNHRWDTQSYSLVEVRGIRYGAVASLRGYSIYGLRFEAGGRTQRILPGLKPRDAETLLAKLKAFGADVPDDPLVPDKLKERTRA
jgi:hypothetical protein